MLCELLSAHESQSTYFLADVDFDVFNASALHQAFEREFDQIHVPTFQVRCVSGDSARISIVTVKTSCIKVSIEGIVSKV